MALPSSRVELTSYIRRRLGDGVLRINVTDTQLDERIDDALSLFQEYHYDASEKVYLKHRISHSNLVCNGVTTGTFANSELFVGSTSNAHAKVYTQANTSIIQFHYTSPVPANTFSVGETVVGSTSSATAVVGSVILGDWDNQYLPIPAAVMGVTRVVPGGGGNRGSGMFSAKYQFLMNDMSWLTAGSALSYMLTRSHMEMLSDIFNGDIGVRFNRHVNRLYLDVDWLVDMYPGDYVVVKAQRIIDPTEFTDIWSDRFLRDYATALVKKQWGQNLMKFEGVQMPGGITLNGRAIYDEGEREAQELEEQIQMRYELPPDFIVA